MAVVAINMRCEFCGNAVRVPRENYDPPTAVERLTNECNICNHAEGGFEQCWYFGADGKELPADPEDFR